MTTMQFQTPIPTPCLKSYVKLAPYHIMDYILHLPAAPGVLAHQMGNVCPSWGLADEIAPSAVENSLGYPKSSHRHLHKYMKGKLHTIIMECLQTHWNCLTSVFTVSGKKTCPFWKYLCTYNNRNTIYCIQETNSIKHVCYKKVQMYHAYFTHLPGEAM